VDDTLLKLGTTTDYNKLRKKTICVILGWSVTIVLMNYSTALYIEYEFGYDIITAMILLFIQNYAFHINAIDDLTTASILALVHFFYIYDNYFISIKFT